jgi:hypothetical protein
MDEFVSYYKSVFSPNTEEVEDKLKIEVDEFLFKQKSDAEVTTPVVDLSVLNDCIGNLKRHKSAGPDNICNEHIILGGVQLQVHICLLFTSMLRHSFIPSAFQYGVIVPLLKNKHGDASKLDMYRAITLSAVMSKLFEYVLLSLFGDSLVSDNLQFGFKKDSSCSHALFTFGETVKYFTSRGSKIFSVSLDASKAFDKVLHNGLFLKMLNKGIAPSFVQILSTWYRNLFCSVSWNSVISEAFIIKCGVRQGGVLSPYLFSFYIDALIEALRNSGYGVYIANCFAGCILYADDILLLSCSCQGLQKLLILCEIYAKKWDICFNPSKCQAITFGGKAPKTFNCTVNLMPIHWVNKMKYLGVYFLTDTCRIDTNIAIGRFYGNFNNILSVLGNNRNEMSAVHLMKTYCLPTLLYACEIWSSNLVDFHKLNVVWNNCFRKIFNCCWRENVFSLLFYTNTLSLSYLIDERKLLFLNKLHCSNNTLLCILARNAHVDYMSLASKYNICSYVPKYIVKNCIWRSFCDSIN